MIGTQDINSAAARNSVVLANTADMITFEQCKEDVRKKLSDAIAKMVNDRTYKPEAYSQVTVETIEKYVNEVQPAVAGYVKDGVKQLSILTKALKDACVGYDVLEEVMHADNVSEIQINDYNTIRVERNGKNQLLTNPTTGKPVTFGSMDNYRNFINQLLMEDNKKVTETQAIIDSITKDGYRVNVIGETATVPDRSGDFKHKPINCTIRRQPESKFSGEDLVKNHTMSNEIHQLFEIIPRITASTFIVGATGSGKTVLLQLLADNTPAGTRISAMGYPAELKLRKRDASGVIVNNVVHLEAREWTGDGEAPREFPNIANVNAANLRLTPELMIFEEIRRKEEFAFCASAGNTGHTFYTTFHAKNCRQAATRVVVEYLAANPALTKDVVVEIVAGFLKFIIVQKKMPDGTRKVIEIAEVCGWELNEGTAQLKLNMLFKFVREDDDNESAPDVITDEYLRRTVVGNHYRVGCLSEEAIDLLRDAGFPKKSYALFVKPLQKDSNGKDIPELGSYEYKPLMGQKG